MASAAGSSEVGGVHSGAAKGAPTAAARSRATPMTDMASGRLAPTSRSHKTSGRSPSASASGAPGSGGGPSSGIRSFRIRMPSASSLSPSSAPEQHMPKESWPRMARRRISTPPPSTAPTRARGTKSPTAMLKAPQQTWTASPRPSSTSTSWIRSASGWGRRPRTLATTTLSGTSPVTVMDSTARPRALRVSANSAGSPSMPGANSRSHDNRTFTTAPPSPHQNCRARTGLPSHRPDRVPAH